MSATVSSGHSLGSSKIGQDSNTEGNFTMTGGSINVIFRSIGLYTIPAMLLPTSFPLLSAAKDISTRNRHLDATVSQRQTS
ncbi:hypothetical protein BofuT4_P131840.1 [Botrytis cinerea T4]|uniref:Uncharacterized protein n=1 Tax=Botryotinia fuckeliana (strain T4) TaxID=999810 RepID=G2YQV6_BOTF4|nr:hypothetical protein BofuT4_P131840.1 [Botrytis cinerea T4]